jgi:hypothetical protein
MSLNRLKDRGQIFVQRNRENKMKKSCTLTAAVFALSMGISTAALAGKTATLNQCWGEIASDVANLGVMGDHTNANGQFIEQPREGVRKAGTSSAEEDAGSGGLGLHAIRVGTYFEGGLTCEQQGTGPTIP